MFVFQAETKKALLRTAMSNLSKLSKEELAYIIGMELAHELKEADNDTDSDD